MINNIITKENLNKAIEIISCHIRLHPIEGEYTDFGDLDINEDSLETIEIDTDNISGKGLRVVEK